MPSELASDRATAPGNFFFLLVLSCSSSYIVVRGDNDPDINKS